MKPCWYAQLQKNWDHVLKTWKSSSLISDFINSIISPVHWRTFIFVILRTVSSSLWPIFLTFLLCMVSSPLRRKLLRFPSSLLAASSRPSRELWSKASRGCGSAQGGSRASGASPALVRQCRSCCRPEHKHAFKIAAPWCDNVVGVRMTMLLKKFFRAWFWLLTVYCRLLVYDLLRKIEVVTFV